MLRVCETLGDTIKSTRKQAMLTTKTTEFKRDADKKNKMMSKI